MLATLVPANALPGERGIVELGDVVTLRREPVSFPIFRHDGRSAAMVTAELAGEFEAPVYGMMAVAKAFERVNWATCRNRLSRFTDNWMTGRCQPCFEMVNGK